MANRIERLIKIYQDQQEAINLFLKKKLVTDHNIVKAYVQVWKDIDARYDRNRYQAVLQDLY
jgi:DNA/RNA-binding domain of Phe-tRNA-synthetase-like protein